MKINFITNQPLNETSGGWSGISYRVFKELEKHASINFVCPKPVSPNLWQHLLSKGKRILGLKGNFFFFSEKRLKKLAQSVDNILPEADYNLYFGQTPWIAHHSKVPYGAYMDASFPTYMNIFSDPTKFLKKDLQRIEQKEADWLKNATHLFWGSNWCKNEAIKQYNLTSKNHHTVWLGGNIPIPTQDQYSGKLNFVFVSLRFAEKGGYVAYESFKTIHKDYPNSRFQIIGERPEDHIINTPGVEYIGLLNKNIKEDLEKFNLVFKDAFMLIHPTTMDTMGAVLLEAGYFGCPSIAPKSFGIPELVLDNKTGFIVEVPFDDQSFSDKLLEIIKDRERYLEMRKATRQHCIEQLSYHAMVKKIISAIAVSLS